MNLPPRIAAVIRAVSAETGIATADIMGRGQNWAWKAARSEAMRRVRALDPQPSLYKCGAYFNRDHSTVAHACRNRRVP